MKILSLGDIHGRDKWMFHTHGSPYEFNLWKISVENGAPGDCEFWNDMPYMEYDKIIFVGDYSDSYDLSNETILSNLRNIIFFKKNLPNKVVLLLGNHDVQYLVHGQICSGFRSEMNLDLNQLLSDKECDFKIAHQEIDNEGKTWLWTHAGVTQDWLDQVRNETLNPNYRLYEIVKDYENANVADFVNMLWGIKNDRIFDVDPSSGGLALYAGPIWVRRSLDDSPLKDTHQIVGHTPQNSIKVIWAKGSTHHYIDCLWDDCDEALKIKI